MYMTRHVVLQPILGYHLCLPLSHRTQSPLSRDTSAIHPEVQAGNAGRCSVRLDHTASLVALGGHHCRVLPYGWFLLFDHWYVAALVEAIRIETDLASAPRLEDPEAGCSCLPQ